MFFTPLSLAPESGANNGPQIAVRPVWEVDLRSLGYTGFTPKGEQWDLRVDIDPLCFSDRGVLIATFLTHEIATSLARRDRQAELRPLRLHAIFFDAAGGKVQTTREWSIARPSAGIIPARDGKFIVVTSEGMTLYSQTLEPLKELRFSAYRQAFGNLYSIYSSPGGKSVLVKYHDHNPHYQWIDVDSMEPLRSWDEVWGGWVTISDDEIARYKDWRDRGSWLSEVLVRRFDGPWRTICHGPVWGNCEAPRQFINNEVLAVVSVGKLRLIRAADGGELLEKQFNDGGPGRGYRGLSASANGRRFAAGIWGSKGGSALLDISAHPVFKRIMVFDIPSGQWVYTLDAKKQKIKSISALALSPNGSLLAILTDGVVEVYRIPPSSVRSGQADKRDVRGASLVGAPQRLVMKAPPVAAGGGVTRHPSWAPRITPTTISAR